MIGSAVGRCFFNATTLFPVFVLLVLSPIARSNAATVLPVGPITFSTNSDYDSAFKEPNFFFGDLGRDPAGYLSVFNSPSGLAVFDTSAIGGLGGFGGFGGSDANNDLSDFTISADLANTLPGIGGGFLLRFNGSEAGGYAASVHNLDPFTVAFDLFEGASAMNAGFNIFHAVLPLPLGFSVAANTFYPFKVTAVGGTFDFDFADGAAIATFTDLTPSATVGQVGIVVDNLAPFATARLDNFRITAVPEPGSLVLAVLAGVIPLAYRRQSPRRKS